MCKTIGLVVVVIMALLIVMSALSGGGGGDGGNASEPTALPEPIVMTLDELKERYDANQVAADNEFDGEYMELRDALIENITGSATMVLANDGWGITSFAVRCNATEEAVLGVTRGEVVTVRGFNDGMSLGQVGLDECRVEEEGEATGDGDGSAQD